MTRSQAPSWLPRRPMAKSSRRDLRTLLLVPQHDLTTQIDARMGKVGFPALRPTQAQLLAMVEPSGVRLTDLVGATKLPKQTLGDMVDDLEAQRLVERIVADPRLELLGPAPLNVVCFRYRPPACSDERRLKAINREILLQLQESGEAVPSSTQREGRFALRVAITNHRTRLSDIDRLADAVLKLGARIADQIS